MSAIADLINKILWQSTVYFEGLDLGAEVQWWDTVYSTHADAQTTYCAECVQRHIWTSWKICEPFGIFCMQYMFVWLV